MRKGCAVAILAVLAVAGLVGFPHPASADCHLPTPGRCTGGTTSNVSCPSNISGTVVECPKHVFGQQDAVSLTVSGIRVDGQASPTVLVAQVDGPHDYPIGSTVTLTFMARWIGNGSHPETVRAAYSFDAHNVTWASPPGASGPLSDARSAGPGGGFPLYPSYAFTFSDWSGANTTFQWTFNIPDGTPLGTLRIPVAFAVTDAGRERAAQSDFVLHVVSQEVSVIPPPPFWRDPAFILLVGATIGLAVGYILFHRPRPAARRLGYPINLDVFSPETVGGIRPCHHLQQAHAMPVGVARRVATERGRYAVSAESTWPSAA